MIIRILSAAAVCLFLMSSSWAEEQQSKKPEVVIKMGTLAPEGSTWMDVIKNITFLTEKRLKGRIKTTVYGGGVMGDEPDMVRKLRLDQLQSGAFTVQGMVSIAPEMAILELPFLFNSWDEVDVIREKFQPEFEKIYEKRGYVLIALVDQGFIHIYTREPIKTPEELGRQKVWVWAEEPVALATYKALGISPTPLPVPEVLQGLQTGIINAIYTSPLACLAFQWFSQIKYVINVNLRYEPGAVVVTKKAWNALTPPEKKIYLDTVREYLPAARRAIRKDQERSLNAIFESGVKNITLSPREVDVFSSKTRVVFNEFAGKMYPRTLLDDIVNTLKEYRQKRR